MLHEINPRKLNNQFAIETPEPDSYIIFVQGNTILCKIIDGELTLPQYREVNLDDYRYLIRIDNDMFFSSWDASAIGILKSDGYEFHKPMELRPTSPDWLRYGALTAFSYASWYEKNRYCGRCGAFMNHSDKERALICPDCGNIVYPKICPVIIVAVLHGESILLTKYKSKVKIDRYALVAGFAEIGETIEETVEREVMEETGIHVKNLHFYKSQPWAFSDSLIFGFYCEADGDEKPQPDGEELGFAEWIEREKLPQKQDCESIISELIERFRVMGRAVLTD